MRNYVRIKWYEVGCWLDEIDYECRIDISDGPGYPRVRRMSSEVLYRELVGLLTDIIWDAVEKNARPPVFKLPGLHIDVDWIGEKTILFRSHTPSWVPFLRRTVINDMITRHVSRGPEQARKDMEGKIRRYVANSLLEIPSLVFADKIEMWKEAMGL